MTDLDKLLEKMKHPYVLYALALLTGCAIPVLHFVVFVILKQPSISPEPPISTNAEKHRNLEVVDTYSYENRTCSVIRYTTPSTTWQYFLDCKEVKK
jgi:hypothetical protein